MEATVTVIVYNYAGLSVGTLHRSYELVGQVYHDADIHIDWLEPLRQDRCGGNSIASSLDRFVIQVLIRRRQASKPIATRGSVIGAALAGSERGGTVLIFYDEILEAARQYHESPHEILALGLAHEMGHLLLPPPAHSTTGVMRAEWDGDDIRRLTHGSLRFTPDQARAIRAMAAGRGDRHEH